jgi:hypothetical protein
VASDDEEDELHGEGAEEAVSNEEFSDSGDEEEEEILEPSNGDRAVCCGSAPCWGSWVDLGIFLVVKSGLQRADLGRI